MSRARLILITVWAVAALGLATSATSGAATFHTPLFSAFGVKVGCGAQLPELGGMSCFSQALPQTEVDGYLELHRSGEAKLGERGDSPWRQGKRSKLRKGDRWSRAGVRCVRKSVLRCTNGEGHGFTLTPTAFKLF
ncbi:MAG: hypothetical protein ACRDK5_06370 [Solirubrobacterales bacterium]